MANVFNDDIVEFNQYDIDKKSDIIEEILNIRKNRIDSKRFFLEYISSSELSKYDFNNLESLREFRNVCCTLFGSPLKGMGGCNLREEMLKKDIRYAGVKMSDPNKDIVGQFDIRNHVITYSPIFPLFYEELDLCKFANDTYFTSLTFEEILMNQIEYSKKYYVHLGNYNSLKDINKYGDYILEEISKNEMIEYVTKPELGQKVLKKYLKR